jgi:uncharacterized protein with PIN domain
MAKTATLRFYAELKDFLDKENKSGTVARSFDVAPSVKDLIESSGVPHTEVELITIDGTSVDFGYRVDDGDVINVYPVFESFDISPIITVRPEPLRVTRFVADNHLGKLARYLRLLGFDTAYATNWDDPELVRISTRQRRILITRDVELLKHGNLTHGYFIRSTDPREQVVEVIRRFHLERSLEPFSRCMKCNGTLADVAKDDIEADVQTATFRSVDEYVRCDSCGQVFWEGSHHPELSRIVESVANLERTSS